MEIKFERTRKESLTGGGQGSQLVGEGSIAERVPGAPQHVLCA